MSKIIKFHNDPDVEDIEVLFNVEISKDKLFSVYKDLNSGEICLCLDAKYDESDDSIVVESDDEIILCRDDDDFVANKIRDAIGDTTGQD